MHLIHSPHHHLSSNFLIPRMPTLPSPSGAGGLHRLRPFPRIIASASLTTRGGTRRRRRKKKAQQLQQKKALETSLFLLPSSSPPTNASHAEKTLRLAFMEELMQRARSRDPSSVSEAFHDMLAAGLRPGPRSFHALVVSHALVGDEEGAMQCLKREVSAGLCPLHETFICLVRLFGSKGLATRGLEILAAMEKMNFDIRRAWLILVEELVRSNILEDANQVFLKGAEGGLRATDELYDLMIEEDCKAGDHENALTIAYEMEAAGRVATTFHFNCLLSVQATCGTPEIALATFENMEYGGEDYMRPDAETYNWVIQAYTRAESYDRVEDVLEILGMMVEDHKRVQPNMKTYALLVECFTKYCVLTEAICHFHGLKNFPGGTKLLHNGGNYGDPLSLYLRALCREGRIVEMLEALEAMSKDNQSIPPRAMIINRRYRSLVSSWIEPVDEEANLGFEIDYIARYAAEGGLTGERKRWVPRPRGDRLDPDTDGFFYTGPIVTSFKKRCLDDWRLYNISLLRTLRYGGPGTLGNVDESLFERVQERLLKILLASGDMPPLKPKAASKMLVPELKEELEAQGLPIDGSRQMLYQRVQKTRRINRAHNRPLWAPPVVKEEIQVDEELDELISRIESIDGDTEFWKRKFLGKDSVDVHGDVLKNENPEHSAGTDRVDTPENAPVEAEDGDARAEEKGVKAEQSENQLGEQVEKEKAENVELPQIPEDSDNASTAMSKQKKSVKKSRPGLMSKRKKIMLLTDGDENIEDEDISDGDDNVDAVGDDGDGDENDDEDDDEWFPLDPHKAFQEMRNRKIFDVSDMYTMADAWGWTWEKEVKKQKSQKWTPKWEAELAIQVMEKVIELSATPTIEDCAMVLRAAIRAPLPSSFLKILQITHKLGYTFGGPLYAEVITLCLDLGELDAAVAIVADMETTGIAVPDETLDRVLSERGGGD